MADMQLIDIIKDLIYKCIRTEKLVEVVLGTVTNTNPLTIERDEQKLELKGNNLMVAEMYQGNLQVNDKLLLIRQQRTNRYIVLQKLNGTTGQAQPGTQTQPESGNQTGSNNQNRPNNGGNNATNTKL